MIYGTVTFYPKPEHTTFVTQAHDALDDLEGGFLYEFNDENGWKQPIYTRKDLEFFQARPERYGIELSNIRPQRPRPEQPAPKKAEPVKITEVQEKTFVPPPQFVAPKADAPRRMGRPPKDFKSKLEANMEK